MYCQNCFDSNNDANPALLYIRSMTTDTGLPIPASHPFNRAIGSLLPQINGESINLNADDKD